MALFCLSFVRCSALPRAQSELPTKFSIIRDQLEIHSNMRLPGRHRMLNELVSERAELLDRLNLPSSEEPVHVYLFDSENRFHEFMERFYPGLPLRRAFFVQSDVRLAVYAHWSDRVAEDLRHEVAHGYLHSIVPNVSLWLDEGLAEFAEVTPGSNGLNEPHARLLLEQLAKGAWRPNLPRLEGLTSAGDMTQLDYAESWAWVHWLLTTDPSRLALLRGYLREVQANGAPEPLSRTLTRTSADFTTPLIEHLRSLPTRGAPPSEPTPASPFAP